MKKWIVGFMFALIPLLAVSATYNVFDQVTVILNAVTSTGAGDSYKYRPPSGQVLTPANRYVQASLGGASAVSATVVLRCSTDNVLWVDAVSIELTAASSVDGASLQTNCPYVSGDVRAISGTGETVTMTVVQ